MSITKKGQPQLAGILDFDVTNLKVAKESQVVLGNVAEIIDKNETFTLALDFKGSGQQWENMCNNSKPGSITEYRVEFYVEGMGRTPDLPERLLGVATDKLVPNQFDYSAQTSVRIDRSGIYDVSAMITIPQWKGILGFAEGLIIAVHPLED
ncbi:MAG: hypothetical protein H6667_20690 [Ardenticatenaceae bacterium]|nr:hypothetical protein [Ardenticatenaceae bacterium]MCB9445694.1 hypothetical protein [Ardenticatenaceae bacterium]